MKFGHRKDDIHETPDVSHIQNPDVAHEASDVNVRAILQFTFGLFIFGLLSVGLMWLLFKVFDNRAAKTEPPPAPMALSAKERLPSGPRLQGAPGFGVDLPNGERVDLSKMEPQAEYRVVREMWKQMLEQGVVDPQTGARTIIPIEEAMRKVAEGGLPARQQQEGIQMNTGYGMDMPSYSSSGRMTEKRNR